MKDIRLTQADTRPSLSEQARLAKPGLPMAFTHSVERIRVVLENNQREINIKTKALQDIRRHAIHDAGCEVGVVCTRFCILSIANRALQ